MVSAHRLPARRALALGGLALLALLLLAAPTLLWAYHLSAAGGLLERGLAWPTPRQSDSLPATGDPAALRAALAELEQAQRWRPGDPQAYRLAGHAAMAAGDWAAAARALDAAMARAPRNPLIAWEAGLAYEQLALANPGDQAARERMQAAWRAAGFDAATLSARAAEARAAQRPAEAQRWERRAQISERAP